MSQTAVTPTHTNKINFDCAILPTDFWMYSGDIRTNSDNYLEIGINTIKQKIKWDLDVTIVFGGKFSLAPI